MSEFYCLQLSGALVVLAFVAVLFVVLLMSDTWGRK